MNLGWRELPLRALLSDAAGMPVALGHDVRTGGLAEFTVGAATGVRNAMFMPIGTGIAAAVLVDGHRLDADGYAGEIGHIVVDPQGTVCGCGIRGCLETVASAAFIARHYAARSGRPVARAAEVAAAVRAGEPDAVAVWDRAVEGLAAALTTAITLLAPEVVAIGGGLAESGDTLLAPLREALVGRMTFQRVPTLVRGGARRQRGLHRRGDPRVAGGRVILTVTLNAALDVTYHVQALVPGPRTGSSRPARGRVARASTWRGCCTRSGTTRMVTGFAGGRPAGDPGRPGGAGYPRGVGRAGRGGPPDGHRRVHAGRYGDVVQRAGPAVVHLGLDVVRRPLPRAASRADVVVLSGSLPPGLPDHAYAQLIGATPTSSTRPAPPLLEGVAAHPHVVKPNAEELVATTGVTDPLAAARRLQSRGAGAVVASLGEAGLVAVTSDGSGGRGAGTLARQPDRGGRRVCGRARRRAGRGQPWPALLADAVALSAAAVACPLAGDVDLDTYRRLAPQVPVEGPHAHADR